MKEFQGPFQGLCNPLDRSNRERSKWVTGHNHLGAISFGLSDHNNLRFGLRTEEDKEYVLRQLSSSAMMECHLKRQMFMCLK